MMLLEKIPSLPPLPPPPLKISKFLSVSALISFSALQSLLDDTLHCQWVPSDRVLKTNETIDKETFYQHYQAYLSTLKNGEIPEESFYRKLFSFTLSQEPQRDYYRHVFPEDRFLIKAYQPVIQSQFFTLGFSKDEGKVRGQVLGKDSIFWGLQFSFPQLMQNSSNLQIEKIERKSPNYQSFHQVQKFMRLHTTPVKLRYKSTSFTLPYRLGKEDMHWVVKHPQLRALGLELVH